ncbi:MAG: phosphoribosylaminoimidazolesuccinocarboxamide synthase [Patescibacteria group bacterium]
MAYTRGRKEYEGKTQIVWEVVEDPALVILEQKDVVTAHNIHSEEALHKGIFVATIAESCARFLGIYNVPTAFLRRHDERSLVMFRCKMLDLEIVIRKRAFGQILKRMPVLTKGEKFEVPLTELYLKTTGGRWRDRKFPVEDPLLVLPEEGDATVHLPNAELNGRSLDKISFTAHERQAIDEAVVLSQIAFSLLTDAWKGLGLDLVDAKMECGWTSHGTLMVADVIGPDSWRMLSRTGRHFDKQPYRDGGTKALPDMMRQYRALADLSQRLV